MAITQQDNPGKAPMSSWAKLVARRSLRMLTQVSNGWGQQAPAGADAFDPFAGVGGLGRHDAAGMHKGKGKGRETPSSPWTKKGAGSPFASGSNAEKTGGTARSRRAADQAARGAPPSPFEAISAPIRAPRKPVERKPRKASGPGGLVSEHQERAARSEPRLNPRPEPMPDLLALAQTRAMKKRIDRFDAGIFSSADDKIWRATAERQAQLKEKVEDLFDFQALKPRAPVLWAPPGIIMDGPRKGAGASQDAAIETPLAPPAQSAPLALDRSEASEAAPPAQAPTEAPVAKAALDTAEPVAADWPFNAVIGEIAPAAPQARLRDEETKDAHEADAARATEEGASVELVLELLPKMPIEPELGLGAAGVSPEGLQGEQAEAAEKTAPLAEEAPLALTQADGQNAFGFMAPEGAQSSPTQAAPNLQAERAASAESDDQSEPRASENMEFGAQESPASVSESQLALDLGQALAGWAQTDGQLAFQFIQAESAATENGAAREAEATQNAQDADLSAQLADDQRVALWAVGERWEQRVFDWGRAIPGWRQADGQFAFHFTEATAVADAQALSQWGREAKAKEDALAEERSAQENARALADQLDQERAGRAQGDLDWDKTDPGWEQEDGQFAFALTQVETPGQQLDFQILTERAQHEQSTAKQQRVKDLYAEKAEIKAQGAWLAKMGWTQEELDWRELAAQEMTGLSAIRLIATEALAYASVLGAPMQAIRAPAEDFGAESSPVDAPPASLNSGEFEDVEFADEEALAEGEFSSESETEQWGEFSVVEESEARADDAGVEPAEEPAAGDDGRQEPSQASTLEEAAPLAQPEAEPVALPKAKKKKWKATPFRPYAPQDAAEALATAWDANAIVTDDLAEEILGAGHLEDEAESEIDWLTGGDPEKIANWEYESAPLALREHPAFRGIGAETAQNRIGSAVQSAASASGQPPRHSQESSAEFGQESYPAPAASPRADANEDRNEPSAPRDREAQEFMDAILGEGASHSEPQPVESLQAWKERQLREEREAAEADFEGHYVSQTTRLAETRDVAEQSDLSDAANGLAPNEIEREEAELALQHESQLRQEEEEEAVRLAQEELHAQAGHDAQEELSDEQSSPWGDEPLPDLFADAMAAAFGAQNNHPAARAEIPRVDPLAKSHPTAYEPAEADDANSRALLLDESIEEPASAMSEAFDLTSADFEDVEFDGVKNAPTAVEESERQGGESLGQDDVAQSASQTAPSQASVEAGAGRGSHERFATLAAKREGSSNTLARATPSLEAVLANEAERDEGDADAEAQSFMSADPALLDGLLDAATAAPRGQSATAQIDLSAPAVAEEPLDEDGEALAQFAEDADEPSAEISSHAEPSGEGESVVRPDHSPTDTNSPVWAAQDAAESAADAEKRPNGKDMERELGLEPMESATIRESGKMSLGSILGARENRDSFSEDVKNMSDEELADSPENKKKPVESLFSSLLEQAKGVFAGSDGKGKKSKKKEDSGPGAPAQSGMARGDNRVEGASARSGWGAPLQPGESRKIDLSRLRHEAQTALDGAEKPQPGQPLLRAEMFLARLLARHPKTSLRWRAAPPSVKNGLDWSSDSRGSHSTSASMPLGASAPVVGKLWAQTAPLPMPGDAQWEEERKAGHEAAIGALKHFWQNAHKEERERLAAIVCCAQSQQGALTAATFEAAVNAVVPPARARAARNELEDVMSQGDPDWI